MLTQSEFTHHSDCADCGSSDACANYTDGHTFCFSCGQHRDSEGGETRTQRETMEARGMIDYEVAPLLKRKITEETCQKWGYGVGTLDGKRVQVANYRDSSGKVVAQKIRDAEKKFSILGKGKDLPLYGQWLWNGGTKRKMLIITEGEIDALSVSQLQDHRWPVVSLPNGANAAGKAIKRNLEFVESFDEVVLMFDDDEPGHLATEEVCGIITPGKVKVARLPRKDANECLQHGEGEAVISAYWSATPYRPDGIIDGDAVLEKIRNRIDIMPIGRYPHEGLNKMLGGIYARQLVMITAGTGVGKSEFVRECEYSMLKQGLKIGVIALEESVEKSALKLIGRGLKIPKFHRVEEPEEQAGFGDAWKRLIKDGAEDKTLFHDHFGSLDGDDLIHRLKFLRSGCGVDVIILDHISIVVSQQDGDDERKTIDRLATKLRSLIEETGVTVFCISHLRDPGQGRSFEEGGKPQIRHLRGSRALGQLPDTILALSRDTQDEELRDFTEVYVLKDREDGVTGSAGFLHYDHDTGCMNECNDPSPQEEESKKGDF